MFKISVEFIIRWGSFMGNNECIDVKNNEIDLAGWLQGVNVMLTTVDVVEKGQKC